MQIRPWMCSLQEGGLGKRASRVVLFLGVVGAVATMVALTAGPALAAQGHVFTSSFGEAGSGNGQLALSGHSGLAVNDASGDVYVADTGNSRVQQFDSGGTFIRTFGTFATPTFVAVDNSAGASEGDVYVADLTNGTVSKFEADGTPISAWGSGGELDGSTATNGPFGSIAGIAVDSTGVLYVYNEGAQLFEFEQDGTFITDFNTGFGVEPAGISVDVFANLYIVRASGAVAKLEPSGGVLKEEVDPGPTTGLVSVAGDTYVAHPTNVARYSSAAALRETFGSGDLSGAAGLAVKTDGTAYVADATENEIDIFSTVVVPDAKTEPATAVRQTSVTLHGSIGAAEGPEASCEFEYTTDENFQIEGFASAVGVPCVPAGPFTGSFSEPAEAEIVGLSSDTAYRFHIVGSSLNGSNSGEALRFDTVGIPLIMDSVVSHITATGATAEGIVNPNGGPHAAEETTYVVEYVSDADFNKPGSEGEYANAIAVPIGGKAIGSGIEGVKVAQAITGLTQLTTYHLRLVAVNEAGEEKGPDNVFTTYVDQEAGLPDGRAYEQVTPVDKNGAAPTGAVGLVQAASGGNGITYTSNGGIPGAEGAQQFPNYLASRSSNWSTQGLLPPASGGSSAVVLGWSEDLSQAYLSQASVPRAPSSFFQRDSSNRSLRMIADGGEVIESFTYGGASADNAFVAFESNTALFPSAAPGTFNTYAWDKTSGEFKLLGVLNDGTAPTGGSLLGSGRGHYNQAQHAVSSDGSRVFFKTPAGSQIYLRQNPTQPQSALDEGECTDPSLACTVQISASQSTTPDPNGEQPATFWTATLDGSKAFFTSGGKLTDGATTGPNDEGSDLYRYDSASGELTDLAPDPTDPNGAEVQGVLGASHDGSYVYFVANGVFDSAPSQGTCSGSDTDFGTGICNLYLWHNGAITYIARQALGGNYLGVDSANWLLLSVGVSGNSARVAPNGQTLLFRSRLSLTGYDNTISSGECISGIGPECPEFYRYTSFDGDLSCVSCNPTGLSPLGPPKLQSIRSANGTIPPPAAVLTRNLSTDGNRIFFESPDPLVASDVNNTQDVYEWEAAGAGSCPSNAVGGSCLFLVSTGTSPEPSYFADAGTNGNDAFLYTAQPLVGQDKDQIVDIYDARVGGGIASQNPSPVSPPCLSDDACKPSPLPPPLIQSPGTAGFSGPGNPTPCKRDAVRRHGKCVKKKNGHHKKKNHHKKSASNGKHG